MSNKIILGTVQLGLAYGINNTQGKPTQEEAFAVFDEAMRSEIKLLDTASAYGNAEELIGGYHRQKANEQFSIITKFHHDKNLSTSEIVKIALTKLNIDQIAVMMFHSFKDFSQYPDILKELVVEKAKGKIKSIGVSVYENSEIENLLDVQEVEILQVPFNMLDNDSERGSLLKKAKKRGKIIHTRSTFLQGLFFKEIDSMPVSLKSLMTSLKKLIEIQKRIGVSMHQLALAYALSQPYIDNVLIGVENSDQLKGNLQSLKYNLPNDIFEEINSIRVADPRLLNPSSWKL